MSSEFDAGDGGKVDKRKIHSKIVAESRLNGLRKLAGDKDGRCWLWQFLEQASPFVSPFDAASDSRTAFNCGTKIITVQITEQMLTLCPDKYYLMLKESKEKPEIKGEDHE